MKVDGSYASLLQGVSQQPARTRLDGQCTLQENFSSNPVKGLTRRAPTRYISKLFAGTGAQFFNFLTNGTLYIPAATTGGIRVFDTAGNAQTVNIAPNAELYLDGGSLSFTDVDDTAYISNRNTVVTMLADTKDYVDTGSIVFLLGGQYGRKYTISIAWSGTAISVFYQTPDGSTSSDIQNVATDFIAGQLVNKLNANVTFAANFSVTRAADVLYIQKTSSPASEDFTVSVSDGSGGTHLYAVNNTVKDVSKVPKYAPQGYLIKITGDAGSEADDWYLEFSVDPDEAGSVPSVGAGFGREGRWVETVAPAIPYLLDTTTMPHILTYDANADEFTFSAGDWAGRQVGSEDSNPSPSFVDRTIEHIAYFQGRLAMVSGPAIIMSRTNKPLDFWFESATATSDTDPIDIESTANGVEKLYRAIPHNRDLVVFSDRAQFVVFGRNTLTPENSSLVLTTAFEADFTADPVAAGRVIFFSINYGQYGGVREFYTDNSLDINDSRPITQHVSTYIQGTARRLISTSNFDTLLVQGSNKTDLYVYEYIWVNDQKVQTAWSKWVFSRDIVHAFFNESTLYIITHDGTDYHLECADFDVRDDFNIGYPLCLDSAVEVSGSDTITLPDYYDPDNVVFVQGSDCPNTGLRIPIKSISGQVVTLDNDYSGYKIIYGVPYVSRFKPTMPMIKDSDGVKVGTANLRIGRFLVNYEDSGSMRSVKSSRYREDSIVTYTNIRVADPQFLIGKPPIASGTWQVPFRDDADNAEIEFNTNSHLPLTFTSLEWVGQYSKRGRRITGGGK